MTRSISFSLRARSFVLAALLAVTTFAVEAAPTSLPIPRPEALKPQAALAAFCTSTPSFSGRLTASSSSTTAVGRITNPNVYGYISRVDAAWSCTNAYRYSALTWNTGPTLGTFNWGNLIASTSVACNWVVGSTDYFKANGSTDCPDTDAEYAMQITFDGERIYHDDSAHNSTGDMSWAHSDCGSYYQAEPVKTGVSYLGTDPANRPGSNCDPIVIDGFNTSQSITADWSGPVLGFRGTTQTGGFTSNPAFVVEFAATDAPAGFDPTHPWTLSRSIATATNGSCGSFAGDTGPGSVINGTTNSATQTSSQTLANGKCHYWGLFGFDTNDNLGIPAPSGVLIVDTTPPATDFTTPNEGTTTNQNIAAYSVAWTEPVDASGVVTRSLQRKRAAWTNGSCAGLTFADDGGSTTAGSPVSETLATGNCYYWVQTLTDRAGNSGSTNSGYVTYDGASPTVDFSAPAEGLTIVQPATSFSVGWLETAGSGTITSRSLQRQSAAVLTPNTCAGLTFASDGSPSTATSPVNSTGLTSGTCYRWTQTLTNSFPKTGVGTSGSVLVDTVAPVGSIVYPEANRALAGDVIVTGSAIDTHSFQNYQLEFGAGISPGSWTQIGTFTSPVVATNPLATWSTGTLSGAYTLRLTVRDNAGNPSSVTTRLVYLDNGQRGDEAYQTRVPFDLGGGLGLDIGTSNGEARLSRDLFSIPSYGPPQDLSLSYSSLETSATGKFGTGWTSNLSQYLTFESGFVVWHRTDGGRVPFGNMAGVWTPLRGHFEILGTGTGVYTVTLKDQTKLTFENAGAGRLTKIENRFGKALTVVWNTSSATSTDASSRVTTLVIDAANNRITGATDSAGRAWGFGYTGTDLTSITDPASKVTTLGYDASHRLTSVTRIRSRVVGGPEAIAWTVGYTSGKATSVTDPVNATVANTFTYNAGSTVVGLLKEYAGPVRNTTTYTLDSLGRVTTAVDPDGYTSTWGYDPDSNVTSTARTVAGGAVATTSATYDPRGNLLTDVTAIGAASSVTTAFSYNATNDLLIQSEADTDSAVKLVTKNTFDAAGHLTSANVNCTTSGTTPPAAASTCTGAGTQDAATNLITMYTYTANHQLDTETDPLGRLSKHQYDTFGNGTTTTQNYVSGQTATADRNVATIRVYDQLTIAGRAGLATSSTDPVGNVTTVTYDALGRQLAEILPGDTSIPALTRTTTYDELGNILTAADAWTPLGGGSPITRTTTHAYDLANRGTSLVDPAGVTTTTIYDAAGDPVDETAAAVQTTVTYSGNRQPIVVGRGGVTDTSQTYDGLGNEVITDQADAYATLRTYTYTGLELTSTIPLQPAPITTTRTYDPLGRELTVVEPAGTTVNTYDRTGRLLTTTTAAGLTTYTYDRVGNQTSVTDTAAVVATTTYDALNRPTVTIANDVASPTLPSQDVTTKTFYDASGATIATTDAKGVSARFILNVRAIAKQVIANCTDSGTTPTSNPPACTGAGTQNQTTNVKTNITFDGTGGALMSIASVGTGAQATTETAFDAAGRAQAVRDPMGTVTRTIYSGGQVASVVVNCTNQAIPGLPTGNWWECLPSTLNDGTWNITTAYGYDPRGNRINETAPNGRVTTTEYDAADRVTKTVANDIVCGGPDPACGPTDDVTTLFFYDEAGRQAAVNAPAGTGTPSIVTRYQFDLAGRVTRDIRNCVDAPATEDPASCVGNDTAVAPDKNVVTDYAYDANGNRTKITAPDPSATGTSVATVVTRHAFDAASRLCRVVQNSTQDDATWAALAAPCSTPISGTTTTNVSTRYTYDGAGNLASMIDANGQTTMYGYDAAGRMTSTGDALGQATIWAYNDLGQQISQTNRSDLTPLTPTIIWTYDGAGRQLTRTVETAAARDTAAPAIPTGLTATAVSATRIDLAWTASADDVGVAKYTLRRNGAVLTQVSGATTAFSDVSVAGSTAYSYTVDAADAGGNASAQSTAAAATTPAGTTTVTTLSVVADTYVDGTNGGTRGNNYGTSGFLYVHPVRRTWLKFDASAIPPGAVSLARLSVLTNGSSFDGISSVRRSMTTSWTETGLTWNNAPAYDATSLGTIGSNILNTRTYLTVTSTVTGQGLYSFVLVTTGTTSADYKSKEVWPGAAYEAQLEVTTPFYDSVVPTVPTGLSASPAGPNAMSLAWTASTDAVGVQGYKIYRAGVYQTTVGSTAWTDTGLAAATAYSYTVAAVDGTGNTSAQSSSAVATTGPATTTTTYTYDANGNKLSASDATLTISATYDRLDRPLTVDDEDAGTTADTTYTYNLTSPSWIDPTGTSLVTLDRFDRPTSVDGPLTAAFTTAYRADGAPASIAAPNGNTTTFAYDALARETGRSTAAPGPVTRAAYGLAYNRAGHVLSEDSQLTGDPTNGVTTYAYDQLGRVASFTRASTPTAYAWQAFPNRASVQVGANPAVTTTYDAANRPTADTAGGAYASDADGRLRARPGQRLGLDGLGRLVAVRPPTGSGITATYSYDPLDRLRLVDYGSGNRTRFRYVGLTTSVAQTIDDATGSVTRHVGTGWTGDRLLDGTSVGTNLRYYGTNSHHDLTWTGDATGAVVATLRSDPFGNSTSSTGSSLPDFRFQGSWFDTTTSLSWVVTRWYAPALGRFISEDSMLGDPADPPSRHLYAYAVAEPVANWDPDGRTAYKSWPIKNIGRFEGKLILSLFIRSPFNVADYPGGQARFHGDSRSWGPDCKRSRGCISIDFTRKTVQAQVTDTCSDFNFGPTRWFGYGCSAAFPIVPTVPWICLGYHNICGYFQKVNAIRIAEASDGAITVVWDITQSRLPVLRPGLTVNGKMIIKPRKCCVYSSTVEYFGEGFPSEEMYWYSYPYYKRRTVFQNSEGHWTDMSTHGNWHKTFRFPG